jgi:membrane-associated protease RseP (regulator of RpoE activity)
MVLFSSFAFTFGVILFFCICLHNLVFSWLCIVFRVRILKFALLLDSWDKHFFKRRINNTEFILGWFPSGGYIKPLGMLKENSEIDTLLPDEKLHALVYKPKYQQMVLKASQYFVWPILLTILIFLVNLNVSFINNLSSLLNYVGNAFQAMFGLTSREDFIAYSSTITVQYQPLPFSLLICSFVMMFSSPVTAISQLLTDSKNNILIKGIGWLLTLSIGYLVLWKIPSFTLSFFSWLQILKYFISVILGIYITGFITYWVMIPIVNLNKI